MTYEEARKFIDEANQYGIVPGLSAITELLRRLGNPQEKLKIIHIAGTNGKGSTSSFLAKILTMAGYSVGIYNSPAVFSYREIIQIGSKRMDGFEYITEQGVSDAITIIKPICRAMVEEGFAHPTTFEIETAMAFLYLSWRSVDFAIIEAGMGGKLDATNVIKYPICSIITSVSMDHMQYLGDSLEQIAREKAGIIKEQVPLITCKQEPVVLQVLEETCREKKSLLTCTNSMQIVNARFLPDKTEFTLKLGSDKSIEYQIQVLGEHQIENALLARAAAKVINDLGYTIDEKAIWNGLNQAKWKGRFEVIDSKPCVIMDGAHNIDAAKRLRNSIKVYFTNRRIIYIIGVLADKDYQGILNITAPLAEVIITLTPNNKRALPSSKLAEAASVYCKKVIDAGTVDQAVASAYQIADKEDIIIVFGSLSYMGDLLHTLENRKRGNI